MTRGSVRAHGLAILEAVVATAVASLAVAALETVADPVGLGVVYLLAVVFIAVRRGEMPAMATALFSVLVFNFLFIEPRYRLAVAHSEDVIALAVFLIVASVVSRLAAAARARADEAQDRAREAERHERVSQLLADAASSLLGGGSVERELASERSGIGAALARTGLRVSLSPVPTPRSGELSVSLKTATRSGWLHASPDRGWDKESIERLREPLARLSDLALERERVAELSAEAEAATRADVAKTAVLHAISHDLRSPLTAITTALAGLRASWDGGDREELLWVVEEEAERLNRMVTDLLDLSRIEAGAVDPQTDWCDLGDVVASAVAEARARRGDHPIALRLDALPLVRADAAQLERVFANLIENAIKFSEDGAPVAITAAVGGSRVVIRVTNRGRPIPQSQRRHVFEPFFRGREGATGAGLGLAICRGFVEANGGQIMLQSPPRDGGATFAVSFPITRQPSLSHGL